MKMRSLLGALILASLSAMPAWSADMTPEEIKKLVDEAVEKRLKEHERKEGAREQKDGQAEETGQPGIGTLPEVGKERRADMEVN